LHRFFNHMPRYKRDGPEDDERLRCVGPFTSADPATAHALLLYVDEDGFCF